MANEDLGYKAFVRGLPCCIRSCRRPAPSDIHHHTSRRGYGQRAHDKDGIPVCRKHHDQFHSGTGLFAGWEAQQRRAWQDEMVNETRGIWNTMNDPETF